MTTTWNPSDKTSGITLSNTNHTASWTLKQNGVRSTSSKSTGKFYFEATFTNGGGGSGFSLPGLGFANALETFTSGNGGSGVTSNSLGTYINGGGQAYINGSNVSTFASSYDVSPVTTFIAVDIGSKLLWISQSNKSGVWNNSAPANPATGTGGINISSLASGPYFICCGCDSNITGGATCTLNAGDSAFVGSIPSGFSAWDGGAIFDPTKGMFRLVG